MRVFNIFAVMILLVGICQIALPEPASAQKHLPQSSNTKSAKHTISTAPKLSPEEKKQVQDLLKSVEEADESIAKIKALTGSDGRGANPDPRQGFENHIKLQKESEDADELAEKVKTTLSSMGPKIIPQLVISSKSKSWHVEMIISSLLAQFGGASVKPVVAMLNTGSNPGWAVAAALKSAGSESMPPLVAMLKSKDVKTRHTAIATLEGMAVHPTNIMHSGKGLVLPGEAVNLLCSMLNTDEDSKIRRSIVNILTATAMDQVAPCDPKVLESLEHTIKDDRDSAVRISAVSQLGMLVKGGSRDDTMKAAKILADLTRDKDGAVREAAVGALGLFRTEGAVAVPALRAALKDHDQKVSTSATYSLGIFGSQAPQGSEARQAPQDSEAPQDPQVLAELIKTIETEPYGSKGKAAFVSLRGMGSKAAPALPALCKLLQANDTVSKSQAACTLGFFGDAAAPAIPDLIPLLKDDNLGVKLSTALALFRIGKTAAPAVPGLIPLLKDEHSSVRLAAIRALGAIGPEAKPAEAALTEIVNGHSDAYEQALAQQSLKKINGESVPDSMYK